MGLFVFQSERAETRDERAKDETVALNRCAATANPNWNCATTANHGPCSRSNTILGPAEKSRNFKMILQHQERVWLWVTACVWPDVTLKGASVHS